MPQLLNPCRLDGQYVILLPNPEAQTYNLLSRRSTYIYAPGIRTIRIRLRVCLLLVGPRLDFNFCFCAIIKISANSCLSSTLLHTTPPKAKMPSSGLYRDYLNLQLEKFTRVKDAVRRKAYAASNTMSLPVHNIITDKNSVVLAVTPGFLDFTGYSEEEMVGRKCNFLQGKETDPNDVVTLATAVSTKRSTSVVILNYRKDGTPFWNILTIRPELDRASNTIRFTGEVVGLLVPMRPGVTTRLCLDDALALISVFASIPRGVPLVKPVEDVPEVVPSSSSTTSQSTTTQRHINYGELLGSGREAATGGQRYEFIAETSLPTEKGRFRVRAYRDNETGAEPLALIVGDVERSKDVICRVHDQCVTSEVFGSLKCDCKQQLDYALEYIQENESGILFYLPQEGRGIGIANKIAAYSLQENGLDTVDANRHLGLPDDAREYSSVRDILEDLEIPSVKILTNNPRKIACLEELDVNVTGRIPCICTPNSEYSRNYVNAKAQRMGHMINFSS